MSYHARDLELDKSSWAKKVEDAKKKSEEDGSGGNNNNNNNKTERSPKAKSKSNMAAWGRLRDRTLNKKSANQDAGFESANSPASRDWGKTPETRKDSVSSVGSSLSSVGSSHSSYGSAFANSLYADQDPHGNVLGHSQSHGNLGQSQSRNVAAVQRQRLGMPRSNSAQPPTSPTRDAIAPERQRIFSWDPSSSTDGPTSRQWSETDSMLDKDSTLKRDHLVNWTGGDHDATLARGHRFLWGGDSDTGAADRFNSTVTSPDSNTNPTLEWSDPRDGMFQRAADEVQHVATSGLRSPAADMNNDKPRMSDLDLALALSTMKEQKDQDLAELKAKKSRDATLEWADPRDGMFQRATATDVVEITENLLGKSRSSKSSNTADMNYHVVDPEHPTCRHVAKHQMSDLERDRGRETHRDLEQQHISDLNTALALSTMKEQEDQDLAELEAKQLQEAMQRSFAGDDGPWGRPPEFGSKGHDHQTPSSISSRSSADYVVVGETTQLDTIQRPSQEQQQQSTLVYDDQHPHGNVLGHSQSHGNLGQSQSQPQQQLQQQQQQLQQQIQQQQQQLLSLQLLQQEYEQQQHQQHQQHQQQHQQQPRQLQQQQQQQQSRSGSLDVTNPLNTLPPSSLRQLQSQSQSQSPQPPGPGHEYMIVEPPQLQEPIRQIPPTSPTPTVSYDLEREKEILALSRFKLIKLARELKIFYQNVAEPELRKNVCLACCGTKPEPGPSPSTNQPSIQPHSDLNRETKSASEFSSTTTNYYNSTTTPTTNGVADGNNIPNHTTNDSNNDGEYIDVAVITPSDPHLLAAQNRRSTTHHRSDLGSWSYHQSATSFDEPKTVSRAPSPPTPTPTPSTPTPTIPSTPTSPSSTKTPQNWANDSTNVIQTKTKRHMLIKQLLNQNIVVGVDEAFTDAELFEMLNSSMKNPSYQRPPKRHIDKHREARNWAMNQSDKPISPLSTSSPLSRSQSNPNPNPNPNPTSSGQALILHRHQSVDATAQRTRVSSNPVLPEREGDGWMDGKDGERERDGWIDGGRPLMIVTRQTDQRSVPTPTVTEQTTGSSAPQNMTDDEALAYVLRISAPSPRTSSTPAATVVLPKMSRLKLISKLKRLSVDYSACKTDDDLHQLLAKHWK